MKNKTIFLDGTMISATKRLERSLSPGILNSKGVFETMRAYQGKIFALEQHLNRMFKGLRHLKIKSPYSKKQICEYLYLSLWSNKLKDARIRLAVWKQGRCTRIAVVTLPCQSLSKKIYAKGGRAIFSDIRRNENSPLTRIKFLDYRPLAKAYRQAQGCKTNEAILLNRKGLIAEGSRSNIFFVKNNVLHTPALSCGCLNGITRQIIIRLARQSKIPCRETKVLPKKLFSYDEIFMTNSLIELMPIISVSGRSIGSGKVGPVTRELTKHYKKLIKKSLRRCR